MRYPIGRLALLLLVLSLAACASIRSIVADFDIDGTGKVTSENGGLVEEAQTLTKLKRPPGYLSPFEDLHYEGALLSADLKVNSAFTQLHVLNKSGSTVQLRFDQATLSSNHHAEPLALQAYSAVVQGKLAPGNKNSLVSVPAMVLRPGERGLVSMSPYFRGLYPSARMFGVQTERSEPVVLTSGVGNSLRLMIPVEYADKRAILVFDLLAKQTHVRSSYY